jgi:hypothetical protein
MKAVVDTNVLLRMFVADNAAQSEMAAELWNRRN